MDAELPVLIVCQNKGGDGKSTTSRLVGEYASRQGKRVLMIDMDAQCNLSKRFLRMDTEEGRGGALPPMHPEYEEGEEWDGRSSIIDVYNGRINKFGLSPYPTSDERIDILPGSGQEMRDAEMVRREDVREKIIDQLRKALRVCDFAQEYDLVVIDTPPAKSPLVLSAIRAATHMLVPAQMAQQSIEGLHEMILMWRSENRMRPADQQLKFIGVLPNKLRNVAIQSGLLQSLRDNKAIAPFLLPMTIGERTVFAEADHPNAQPKSVFDLPASDKARSEATEACRHIFESLFGQVRNAGLTVVPASFARTAEEGLAL